MKREIGDMVALVVLTFLCIYMAICAILVTGMIIHALIPFIPTWVGAIIGTVGMIFIEIICFGIFTKD